MHSFGGMLEEVKGINLTSAVLVNALFNTGVSCFILISGYFGVRLNIGRLLKLDAVVLFYSILSTVFMIVSGEQLTLAVLVQTVFPVIGKRYWFISCYFCLTILSPFINRIPESLEKKDFERLLLICLMIFSVMPTIFFVTDNIMSDAGKGLANMLLMYLIGRYIRLYGKEHYQRGKILWTTGIWVLVTFSANMFLAVVRGVYTSNFSRDYSITIIMSAICLFLFFRELSFQSRIVNFLARNVIAAYVFEGTVRGILNCFFDLTMYVDCWYLSAVTAVYVIVVLCICFAVNIFRMYTIGLAETPIAAVLENRIEKVLKKIETGIWESGGKRE